MTAAHITDDDLHAYVDGALDPARAAAIEAWLDNHPDDAARVRRWRDQIGGLHQMFDPVLDESLPERLRPGGIRGRRAGTGIAMRVAASILLVAFGAAGGWLWRDATEPPPFAATLAHEAVTAHLVYASEVRHPVEVAAAEQDHLIGWLSKRLGKPLRAPDLRARGFHLMGGRLLPADDGPAAQFMYEEKSGQRITVYVRQAADAGETAFRFAGEGAANAFYWKDGGLAYAIVGAVPRDRLTVLASAVYDQLSEPPRAN